MSSNDDTVKTKLVSAHEMQQNEVERGGDAAWTPRARHSQRYLDIANTWIVPVYLSTMENWLSQLGSGNKHLTDRYTEYPAPAHDQQLFYTYEPSSPPYGHVASSKHHYGGGGHKHNAAMSALTLLAFLFFLHILQQCLKEHMTAVSTPQVMVVSAGREGEQAVAKTSNKDKLDRAGVVHDVTRAPSGRPGGTLNNKERDEDSALNASTDSADIFLTRIATAEHTPQSTNKSKNKIITFNDGSSAFDRLVNAMDEQ